MLKIELAAVLMTLSNVNVRAEIHGPDREPASDLKLEANMSNDILVQLAPDLKGHLYHYDDARSDLSEKGKKEPGFLPHLRFPKMCGKALPWNDEMKAKIAIVEKGAKKAIELEGKVNQVEFEPKDGGTVFFKFRFQCKPNEQIFGKLGMLIGAEVEVTLAPAE